MQLKLLLNRFEDNELKGFNTIKFALNPEVFSGGQWLKGIQHN